MPTRCWQRTRATAAGARSPCGDDAMSARLLDGKTLAARVTDEVRAGVAERVARGGSVPGLAVVMVGDNAASQVYVRNKRRTTDAVGMRSFAFDPPADVSEGDLLALIDQLNADAS